MPLIQRYTNTLRGALTITGNTLGFSYYGGPSFAGIAAFLSTTPGLTAPNYPSPSTINWQQNGSSAILNIPPGSTILYAELVWGGGSLNFTTSLPLAVLNTPITFKTPLSTNTITYDPTTAFYGTGTAQIYYTRSQNVTNLVKAAGAGKYEVDGVPAILSNQPQNTDGFTTSGWNLIVAYSNESLNYTNLNIYIGNDPIIEYTTVDTTISGFYTPLAGPVNARVLVSAMQGDSQYTGDQLLIGPTIANLTALSGPNNPVGNFFTSMINNDSGNIDTNGSFGNLNQIPGGFLPVVRNNWDITNVDASSAFVNSQQSAVVRLDTTGDTFAVSTLGVEIAVNLASIKPNKTVDKAYAKPGDTLTYTVVLQNTGYVQADNVIFTDSLPNGVTYVLNSLISSAPYTGSLNTQITLTNPIPAGGSVTLSYKVVLGNTLPNPNPMINTATVSYSSVPAQGLSPILATDSSNTVTTQVNTANITEPGNFTKTVDKAFAKVGDILTYTVKAKNSGNVAANNVFITDPIPVGTNFVVGSIVSSAPIVGDDISNGITLINPLLPGSSVTIAYKVSVDTIPSINPTPNTANISYKYSVDPSNPNGASNFGNSNTVFTQINHADLTKPGDVSKVADKAIATINDIITYTITMKNSGNVGANNVIITDTIPSGTTFVQGSIISTSPFTGDDPNTGITLSRPILPNSTVIVTYKVKVNTVPTPNTIKNVADVAYKYTIDPANPNGASGNVATPPAITKINAADLISPGNFTKTTDKNFANIGDTITYTIKSTNTGNTSAINVVITDTLPSGSSFIPGSITSTVAFTGTDPTSGITLTNPILPNSTVTITYKVKVNIIPNPNPMVNIATVNYKYIVDPSYPNKVSAIALTPPVNTQVNNANLSLNKISNKQSAIVGDIITYTISFTNIGNVSADKIIIIDNLPSSMIFVPSSITSSEVFTGNDITTGISLTNPLLPGASVVVTFKAKVISSNVVNPTKNTVTINYKYTVDPIIPDGVNSSVSTTDNIGVNIYNPSLKLVKSSNKNNVVVGDTLTYTITATNNGNISLGSLLNFPIMIYDNLSSSLEFVPGSLNINKISHPLDNIGSGINIGTLNIGESSIISFDVKVLSNIISPITNNANSTFGIPLSPGVVEPGNSISNTVSVIPELATLDIVKTSDKQIASLGDIITYTVKLTNDGNVDAINVIFKDILPLGTTLIDHSFMVNNNIINGVDLVDGVNIGNILVGNTTTVVYSVNVVSPNCSMKLINTVYVSFSYILASRETGYIKLDPTTTSINEVSLGITNFKQFSIEGNILLPCEKQSIKSVNTLKGEIDITNSTVIKTTPSKSLENQNLTNYKLVVNGLLKVLAKYTSINEDKVYSQNFNIPFSTFIILPINYCSDSNIKINSEIEDLYNNISDGKNLFINATALINVSILSCNC